MTNLDGLTYAIVVAGLVLLVAALWQAVESSLRRRRYRRRLRGRR